MTDLTAFTMLLVLHMASFGCLALSQAKHWRMLMGPPNSPATVPLRWMGGTGLITSLVLAISVLGFGFGGLTWLLLLPLAGYAVAFGLATGHSAKQRQAKAAALSARQSRKP